MNQTKKVPKGSFGFCIFIGICGIVLAIFFAIYQNGLAKDYAETSAVITAIEPEVLVTYTYEGEVHEAVKIATSHTLAVGDELTVYVQIADPEYAILSTGSNSTFIAFLVIGILFTVAGVAGLLVAFHLDANSDSIIDEGNFVWADVDQVVYATEIDDREPVNSAHGMFHTPVEEDYDETEEVHHPYIIYCHYTNAKGRRKDYIVPNVWVDPYPYLERHSNQVKVYIKGNNLNRYRFDLSMFERDE